MNDLPVEVLIEIFQQLDPFTIAKYRRVCRCFDTVLTTHPFSNLIGVVHIGQTDKEYASATVGEVFCFVTPASFGEAFLGAVQKQMDDSYEYAFFHSYPPNTLNAVLINPPTATIEDSVFKSFPGLDNGRPQSFCLTGPFPSTIGSSLKHLTSLNLGRHLLTGPIPRNLGELIQLRTLKLNRQSVTGPLPVELGNLVNLRELNLSHTLLDGTIPDTFGNLINLEVLDMSSAKLTGCIPVSFVNLINLVAVHLDSNMLSGNVPDIFGRMTKLQKLSLHNNKLEGPIPISLAMNDLPIEVLLEIFEQLDPFKVAKYRRVCRSFNNVLTNPPFSNLIGLAHIGLAYIGYAHGFEVFCFVTPETFGKAFLTIAQNNLDDAHKTGERAGKVKKYPVSSLKVLPINPLKTINEVSLFEFLKGHILSGPLPRALGNMTKLTNNVNLKGNYVTGPLPSELGNLVHLKKLNLSHTILDDTIPDSFGNLINLEVLDIFSARLTGSIPASFRNLVNLVVLNLGSNKLSGKVPDMFGRMTKLQTLSLGDNHLEGPIPESLGRCMQLRTLHCEQNRFSGSIPDSIFRLPLLKSVKFDGNLIVSESPSTDNASSDD
ncbi:hypothetical protein HDU77_011053, partial [Chytriomyces hyalinus]